jgi:hypothetical protein
MAVLSVVLGSIVMATVGTQDVFLENQVISQLNIYAQTALDRIVELSSQALTTDSQFSPLKPTTGVGSHCLRFRLVQSIDTTTGDVIYDDNAQVYLLGPDSGTHPCKGLVVGRGATLDVVYSTGKGPDNFLGTVDDDTVTALVSDIPAVELLVPETYSPRTGTMFTVDVSPAPVGRVLTLTLRLNARGKDGNYVLPNDLVLSERVALRQ